MNKLFSFAQAKGKWHKFPSFNLGRGAKLYKNFAQKLLAVSLCMAVVLLGVPRGQNFVAEAAEEATKSVALLTLTLTGEGADAEEAPGEGSDAEEAPGEQLAVKQVPTVVPLVPVPTVPVAASVEAAMKWKSFVPGKPVGLEVVFVDLAGTASAPRDYGTWLDTYGSMESDDAGFTTFAPAEWLAALPSSSDIPFLFGDKWLASLCPLLRSFLGTRDWLAPLPFLSGASDSADPLGFVGSPGLARVPLGSSLSVLPHPFSPELFFVQDGGVPPDVTVSTAFSVADADASVVSFESSSASIVGVGVGVTTLSLSATLTITAQNRERQSLGPFALGTLAVEVYDPSVPVTGVSLSDGTKSLAVGESFDLTATVTPENATDKTLVWSTSDDTIASVTPSADGLSARVTAVGAGDAGIVCSTADGTIMEACVVYSFHEATVDVKGQQQRLRVYDTNKILPAGTQLKAEAVTRHEHLDDDHEIEHLLAYDLSLLDASGNPLHMPLDAPVELCFEVLDGLDKDELEVVLVKEFDDAEFEENLVDLDGASWVKVKTDHFSPYALTDLLSEDEKAALTQENSGPKNNVKTGDLTTQIAVAGLGMVLVLALGIMLRLITSKKKFEE